MSIAIMSAVWKQGPADRSQRLLLLAIADAANDQGVCWPSTRTLAEKACVSVRSVLRALKVLEQEGWLKVQRKIHEHKGNSYRINLAMLGDKASCDTVTRDELSRDKTGRSQVTKRAESGDKTGNPPHPLLGRTIKNHHEPCEETSQQVKARVIQTVWEYYCDRFHRSAEYIFSTTRKRHAERGYDALVKKAKALGISKGEQEAAILAWFETAIHRLEDSKWHNGVNEQKKTYNDFEILFRSKEHASPDHLTDYWLNNERFGER